MGNEESGRFAVHPPLEASLMIEEAFGSAARDVRSNMGREKITEKLSLFRDNYEQFIQSLAVLMDFFSEIPSEPVLSPDETMTPYWSNQYLPQGDAIVLCGFLLKYNPAVYMEIGSGNSTKFARRVISHFNLRTKIVSVDPNPRAVIDAICDEVIRAPVQMILKGVFQALRKDNILFIDGSHKCLQNSDVTYVFLDILPNLRPGVLIHFHDICWPEDYPATWTERLYNEQYVLGVLLLFGSEYEILYPSNYVRLDPALNSQFRAVLNRPPTGSSIWMRLTRQCPAF